MDFLDYKINVHLITWISCGYLKLPMTCNLPLYVLHITHLYVLFPGIIQT